MFFCECSYNFWTRCVALLPRRHSVRMVCSRKCVYPSTGYHLLQSVPAQLLFPLETFVGSFQWQCEGFQCFAPQDRLAQNNRGVLVDSNFRPRTAAWKSACIRFEKMISVNTHFYEFASICWPNINIFCTEYSNGLTPIQTQKGRGIETKGSDSSAVFSFLFEQGNQNFDMWGVAKDIEFTKWICRLLLEYSGITSVWIIVTVHL